MAKTTDRRLNHRYELALPIHFRVSEKGSTSRWATGVTCDISSAGVSFRCRKPLPLGAHIEMAIEWPARQNEQYPMELLATGFVLRSSATKAAARMNARRFRVELTPDAPLSAIA